MIIYDTMQNDIFVLLRRPTYNDWQIKKLNTHEQYINA